MKNISIINILGVGISLLLLVSCSEKQIDSFDTNFCYFNFEKHTQKITDGGTTDIVDKEYEYSFSLEEDDFTSYTYKFVVILVGTTADYDRPYKIKVIDDKSTAPSSIYSYESNRIIKAGQMTDTIDVKLYRDPLLKDENKVLTLGLVENEHFQQGIPHRQYVSLTISDQLLKPDWWDFPYYSREFGTYYEEVYRKWMEMYYLGYDKLHGGDNNEPHYWRNMPTGAGTNVSRYPALFAAISKLKRYFYENDIYPNGDTTKAPIKLPNL